MTLAELEAEMIRLEDEIGAAKIGVLISSSPTQADVFRAEVARLTEERNRVKEQRRQLKNGELEEATN